MKHETQIEMLEELRVVARRVLGNSVSPQTLYRWASRGASGERLNAKKIGRKWYSTHADFCDFVDRQTAAATVQTSRPAATQKLPADVSPAELEACGLLKRSRGSRSPAEK